MSELNQLQYLDYLRYRAGFRTRKAAAAYFEVSERTWRRWEHENRAKRHIYELLKIKIGYFPFKGWEYFNFRDDVLYTPQNRAIYSAELENLASMFDWARRTHNPFYDTAIDNIRAIIDKR